MQGDTIIKDHELQYESAEIASIQRRQSDLDAYLTCFKRACIAFEVKPEHWFTQIATGKDPGSYHHLTDSDIESTLIKMIQFN